MSRSVTARRPTCAACPHGSHRAGRIANLVKRICRTLELDGYARIDFRLGHDGVPYFLEANPNPDIAGNEYFAQSAHHDGLKFPDMVERIVSLGIRRARVAGRKTSA